jgi:hypothetical protein
VLDTSANPPPSASHKGGQRKNGDDDNPLHSARESTPALVSRARRKG